MSTVQDVLDVVQYRIAGGVDVFPLLNNAISTLAQRLYILDSNLVKEKLEVEAYAEVTYTASTIAFVHGSPDTITDSAAQFVVEGFVAGMLVTSTCAGNTGTYTIATVAAGTITLIATDVLTAQIEGASYTLTTIDDYVVLPATFWGFPESSRLYVDGYQTPLLPLPDDMTETMYTSPGTTTFYELMKDRKLYLYPPTSTDITIKTKAFTKPTAVTDYTDTIPWDGMFDSALAELMLMFYKTGTTTGQETAILLETFLTNNVDTVAARYDKKAEKRSADGGINWTALVEDN